MTKIIIFTVLTIFSFSAQAQDSERIKKLFNSIMSPYCPGRLLAECPSSSASELKQEIRLMTETKTDIEIYSILQERFENSEFKINANPDFKGFNIFAWLVPGFFFLLGLLIIKKFTKS